MKRLLVLNLLFLLSFSTALAAEVSKEDVDIAMIFSIHYSVVSHSLKNDEGYSAEVLIDKLLKKCGSYVFVFWNDRMHDYCVQKLKAKYGVIKNQYDLSKPEDMKRMKVDIEKDRDKCSQSYIYDNWDEINKTIKARLNSCDKEGK
jgi:hypothetical protein